MSQAEPHLILRAEWKTDGEKVVSHTLEVSESSVVIRAQEKKDEGERVHLRLSFPGLLPPIDLEGRIAGHRAASGPGKPAGLEIELSAPARALARLTRVLDAGKGSLPAEGGSYRVLLVEDSAMTRDTVLFGAQKHFLARPDFLRIEEAEDAETARSKLGRESFDLVLVDHYLPGMKGAELTRWIRENLGAEVPVVAISVGGSEARREFMEAGADLYLDKPVIIRDLFWTLDRLTSLGEHQQAKRLLLVDDSQFFLAVAREALEEAGFEVTCATGLEEIENAGDPDLILMDVQMPEAFGDDVAMVMRNVRGVKAPIYLVSSLEESDLKARAEEANIEGYIPKNSGVEHLVERVRSILGEVAQ